RHTVQILTSNVGASVLQSATFVGFDVDDTDQPFTDMKSKVLSSLKKAFRPEFLNRIDETIVFHPLEQDHTKQIVKLMIKQLKDRIGEQDLQFTITDRAVEKIAEIGFDPDYGARPLRRAIQ